MPLALAHIISKLERWSEVIGWFHIAREIPSPFDDRSLLGYSPSELHVRRSAMGSALPFRASGIRCYLTVAGLDFETTSYAQIR